MATRCCVFQLHLRKTEQMHLDSAPLPLKSKNQSLLAPASLNATSGRAPIDDLGTDQPNQTVLQQYPASIVSYRMRSFVAAWCHNRDWLEYSVKANAAFCFCYLRCSSHRRSQTLDVFVSLGFPNWENATERDYYYHY